MVECGQAIVIEAGCHGAIHGHLVHRCGERLPVALHLLADIAEGVFRPLAVELVDGDEIGEIEHVDLLQLALCAKLRRHHVQRGVDQRHNSRIALADAGRFDDDQVELRHAAGVDHPGEIAGHLASGVAGRHRAHEDIRVVDGVHADAVAEQRTAGLAAGRIDRDDGDFKPVALSQPETPHQLVGQG